MFERICRGRHPSAVAVSLINDGLRVRRDPAAIDVVQALTRIRPLTSVGLAGSASATLHLSEKPLERRSLLRRKRGHLPNQFCCAHGVTLVQPGDSANNDSSFARRGGLLDGVRFLFSALRFQVSAFQRFSFLLRACCWAFGSPIPLAASRATCAGSAAGGL
jgi:hypothetical protein